jgi:hypothetical protein
MVAPAAEVDLMFPPQADRRYLRLELTTGSDGAWWSIRDIAVHGPPEARQQAGVALARTSSDSYRQRSNFGARMEPPGNAILSGAGQESTGWFAHQTGGFLNYQRTVDDGLKPVLASEYWHMQADDEHGPDFVRYLAEQYRYFFDWQVTPMIGIEFAGFEDAVIGGQYDDEIHQFCDALVEHFDGEVFLRIGFEPDSFYPDKSKFKQGFIAIHDLIRSHAGLSSAAVIWAPAAPRGDIMEWYPGDQYCDWWGLSPFSFPGNYAEDLARYCEEATDRGKPVFLAETAPIGHDTIDGESVWDAWYAAFFGHIQQQPAIKAFTYINWNWRGTPWDDWGDNRIEANELIRSRWIDEMRRDVFVHGNGPDPVEPPCP